jgi:hypothetical protein
MMNKSINASNSIETPIFYILSTIDGMSGCEFYDKCKGEAYFKPENEVVWAVNPMHSTKTGVGLND